MNGTFVCFTTTRTSWPSAMWPTWSRPLPSFLHRWWTPGPTSGRASTVLSTNRLRLGTTRFSAPHCLTCYIGPLGQLRMPGNTPAFIALRGTLHRRLRLPDVLHAGAVGKHRHGRRQVAVKSACSKVWGSRTRILLNNYSDFSPLCPGPGRPVFAGLACFGHCCGICDETEATQQMQSLRELSRNGAQATPEAIAQPSVFRLWCPRSLRTTSLKNRRAEACSQSFLPCC